MEVVQVNEADEAVRDEERTEGYYGGYTVEAQVDLLSIMKYLRETPKRRACPPWSVPAEIGASLLTRLSVFLRVVSVSGKQLDSTLNQFEMF